MMPTISELLAEHVSLSITSVDRLYINAYVRAMQTPGQLVKFMREHLGKPIASLSLMEQDPAPLCDRSGLVMAA